MAVGELQETNRNCSYLLLNSYSNSQWHGVTHLLCYLHGIISYVILISWYKIWRWNAVRYVRLFGLRLVVWFIFCVFFFGKNYKLAASSRKEASSRRQSSICCLPSLRLVVITMNF